MTDIASNLHVSMNKDYPRTGRCEYCGRTDRKTEYACAGHRYGLNTHVGRLLAKADWFELCRRCHIAFDGPRRSTPRVDRPEVIVGPRGSDALRAHLSAAMRGREVSAETRARMSEAGRKYWESADRTVSAEQREKIAATLRGRKVSAETRAKMSEARKRWWIEKRKGGDA